MSITPDREQESYVKHKTRYTVFAIEEEWIKISVREKGNYLKYRGGKFNNFDLDIYFRDHLLFGILFGVWNFYLENY